MRHSPGIVKIPSALTCLAATSARLFNTPDTWLLFSSQVLAIASASAVFVMYFIAFIDFDVFMVFIAFIGAMM